MAARAIRSSIRMQSKTPKRLLQLLVEFVMGQPGGSRLGDHGQIGNGCQLTADLPEIFAGPALDAIPANRVADFPADGHA
jgi:hypothetical protein